jgi:hypothetical protein
MTQIVNTDEGSAHFIALISLKKIITCGENFSNVIIKFNVFDLAKCKYYFGATFN